ncbi:type II secretion system F family protein [Brucella gallinifaecis]|uniref:Type II secretion system F family protein n=1 Tax=Brucella gallinifaecis TaxID=215590 RepID=A0A502BLU9_9HYPH|nr:type II secretion system F family protein [Brucella gallinifaecis]TPF75452.1 type II secretion system F family protein [Brucella gallinifaecis]
MTYFFLIITLLFVGSLFFESFIHKKERIDVHVRDKSSNYNSDFIDKNISSSYIRKLAISILSNNKNEVDLLRIRSAGFRGSKPIVVLRLARMICPLFLIAIWIILLLFGVFNNMYFYFYFLIAIAVGIIGYFLPGIYLHNRIIKRRKEIEKSWSDVLDLIIVCVETGMTIEAALSKVASVAEFLSKELSEELKLTIAEFGLYPDRRISYRNFAKRANLRSVDTFVQCVIQSEKYGTSVGDAMRHLAAEHRDQRMLRAEKKAAALPPKLTVPMILFFLPVIFAVILTPAFIQVMAQGGIMGGN